MVELDGHEEGELPRLPASNGSAVGQDALPGTARLQGASAQFNCLNPSFDVSLWQAMRDGACMDTLTPFAQILSRKVTYFPVSMLHERAVRLSESKRCLIAEGIQQHAVGRMNAWFLFPLLGIHGLARVG